MKNVVKNKINGFKTIMKNTYYAKTDSEFNAIITDLKNKNLWYTYN